MNKRAKDLAEKIIDRLFIEETGELEELLRDAGFGNARSAAHNVRLIAEQAGASPSLLKKIVIAAAESFDPDAGLNNAERFLRASEDKGSLCSRLERDDRTMTVLMTLLSGSQLLTDAFLQMGLALDWLTSCLQGVPPGRETWDELSAALHRAATLQEKGDLVRAFKKKEYIRIGLRDLLKAADTAETIRDLADLADVCLETAFVACHQELVARHGKPRYEDLDGREKDSRFCVLGLGKLGGQELNFSSDIDILYLYSSDRGLTEGRPGPGRNRINRITNHEYYTKLGALITNFMSEITPEGSIFRVDLRLRPEGALGDIACSLRSYELYYESYGTTLERQALIKARVSAGDRALGERFLRMIRPFIYRKYLDYSAIEEIKQMKETIDRRLRREEIDEGHVKLGYGGIREIEFVIQAFQLVYGGRDEELQSSNSLDALEGLHHGGYLKDDDYAILRDAYLFLRDLENRLQMSHGLQTHSLPREERSMAVLARKMGIPGDHGSELARRLMREYRRHVEAVRTVYDNLFYAPVEVREARQIPLDLDDAERTVSRLAAAGFLLPEKALENLLLLRDGPMFSHPSERSKLTFSHLLPNLLRLLPHLPDPDMALNHLERFVSASQSRETMLSLFLEEERLLDLLMRLFGNSEILSRILIRQPNLLDTLLHPEEMVPFKSRDRFQDELLRTVQPIKDRDETLAEFRRFKQAEDLRIGLKYILGHQDVLETMAELSNLAEAFLRVALVMVEAELTASYGVPTTSGGQKSKLVIIGMGKLGGREMSFGSDLDILMVFSGEGRTRGGGPGSRPTTKRVTTHIYYTRLYEGLLKAVSEVVAGGYAYKIDMRLRPEGDKGSLALPLSKFEDYFHKEEQAWVRQAMIKARPVAGDGELGDRFVAIVQHFTYMKGFGPSLAREIAHSRMRKESELAQEAEGRRDVKHGLGGITDIEFAVQLLQLKQGGSCPKIRVPGTLNALNELLREKLIDRDDHLTLQEAYLFLREVEMNLRIVEERPIHALPHSPEEQDKLARRLGYTRQGGQREGLALMSKYNHLTARVREIYDKIFRQATG